MENSNGHLANSYPKGKYAIDISFSMVALDQRLIRPPQIALSTTLSSRHIVPTFENTLKMAGTFKKRPFKAVIWQARN